MATSEAWPIPTISKVELHYFLQHVVGVTPDELIPLGVESETALPGSNDLYDRFLQTLGRPSTRIQVAEAVGLSYDQITGWVIRADLLKMFYRVLGRSFDLPSRPALDEPVKRDTTLLEEMGTEHLALQKMAKKLVEEGVEADHEADKELERAGNPANKRGIEGFHHLADFVERGLLGKQGSTQRDNIVEQYLDTGLSANRINQIFDSARTQAKQFPPEIIANTQAVVVVKGAGYHKQDEHLDLFLKGFWPAVATEFPTSTMIDRRPLPSTRETDEKKATDTTGRIAEIRTGERRVWVKEAYWEPGITPPGALTALLAEWRMATYVLGRLFWELISSPYSYVRKAKRENGDIGAYLIAFFFAHLLVLFPVALAFWRVPLTWLPISTTTDINPVGFAVVTTIFVAIIISIPPALETDYIMQKTRNEALPGVSGWLLVILLGSLVVHPIRYLIYLGFIILLQGVLILFRKLLWQYRNANKPDSDTDLYQWDVDRTQNPPKVERRDGGTFIERFIVSSWLYRYILVLLVPVIIVLVVIARIISMIPGLGAAGAWLENLSTTRLGGGLGDVVVYANEPGEATWIRGTIVDDLVAFHNRPDVKNIHVFAHSQGTPITYETLFNHLPSALRSKLKTYITIGSVLTYLYQANWVLDLRYIRRFPYRPYPTFTRGFQWVNYWNHTDPIPAFSALDPYQQYDPDSSRKVFDLKRALFKGSSEKVELNPASPLNIKTKGSWLPWESHGEYWTNIDQVQLPFARRVIQDKSIRRFEPAPKPLPFGAMSQPTLIFSCWALMALLIVPIGVYWMLAKPYPIPFLEVCKATVDWVKTFPLMQNIAFQCVATESPAIPPLPWNSVVIGGILKQFGVIDWLTLGIVVFAAVNWVRQLLAVRWVKRTAEPKHKGTVDKGTTSNPTGDTATIADSVPPQNI